MTRSIYGPKRARKAWAAGFAAVLTAPFLLPLVNFGFKAFEAWYGLDIPDPFESATAGLVTGLASSVAAWSYDNEDPA
jgi:uncharacterized PurR-regulated membrane protein YhhQ (DUF165 family)